MFKLLPRYTSASRACSRVFSKSSLVSDGPPVDKVTGLIYGKFTQAQYDEAAKYVKEAVGKIEKDVKKGFNVAENYHKMESFPSKPSDEKIELNSLSQILAQAIKTTGPLPLSSFMRQALTHPDFGYYTTRDPLGSKGDFVTSPEISQMFGEMIGVWLYATWLAQGKPHKLQVIEFGPGKGTLMHDTLKSFNRLRKSDSSKSTEFTIEVVMVEASHVLRKEQWRLLCSESSNYEKESEGTFKSVTRWGNPIRWVDTEKDITNEAGYANYIIAHEFFDALPIQQFKKTKDGWREYMVEHSPSIKQKSETDAELTITVGQDGKAIEEAEFHLTLNPHSTPSCLMPKLNKRFDASEVGSSIEVCSDATMYASKMSQIITANGQNTGACLIIDYGPKDSIPSGTLRGIKDHKIVSPFILPGDVDISADVDFEAIAEVSRSLNCQSFGPVEQGDWLHELGIGYRADQLIKSAQTDELKEQVYNSYTRLTGKKDDEMGSIYKFQCLLPKDSKVEPVGFGGAVTT